MYIDKTTNNQYPKTLLIHNEEGGLVWQVYHVEKEIEAKRLSYNATLNAFEHITLNDYLPDMEQTWKDWRNNAKNIIKD